MRPYTLVVFMVELAVMIKPSNVTTPCSHFTQTSLLQVVMHQLLAWSVTR